MDPSNKLNLETLLKAWENNLKQSNAFSPSDILELKAHILDIINDLIEEGLNEEEAFLIANKRLGHPINWEDEFSQTNQPYIQTRKTLLIVTGAIVYYFVNYFILFLAKFVVVIGKQINIETHDLLLADKIILGIPILLVIFFFVSLFMNDEYLFNAIDKIHFRPKQAVYLVILTLIFVAGDRSMLPLLRNSVPEAQVLGIFFDLYLYFRYIFLFFLVIGFMVIYKKYFNKANGPQIH